MIIIPEIETVVILVPRTGSGTLRRTIEAKYPKAMMIYRHMEADGVPGGYDRWPRVGVVRNPLERMWSLYNFLKNSPFTDHSPAYVAAQKESVTCSFEEWLLNNKTVFTVPYDEGGLGFHPLYNVRHAMPENVKSQFLYLRPDLGTQIYRYRDEMELLQDRLAIKFQARHNAASPHECPSVGYAAWNHIEKYFHWDLRNY